ncbi:MAG: LysM peptidoglycan-binding domain-containing protein [Bacteroidia bacterium]|nr:LysM peptidoglycan-binding domain-containing protein [Bacteroidia bacterium]
MVKKIVMLALGGILALHQLATAQVQSLVRFVEDDPIISVLDSLSTLKFFRNSTFTTDRNILNIYKFPVDSVPKYDDFIYQYRISKLNAKSPFHLVYNSAVKQYIDAYSIRKRDLVPRLLGLSQQYFPLFEEQLDKYNLPLELKYLAIVESALNPIATSKSGARGLWQFMYQTGKIYNLDVTSYVDQRCDPYLATIAACEYFKYLYDMFGNWELVLAAYNGGPGTVNKAIRRAGGKMNYWEIRPYLPVETQGYVPAFFAVNYIMNYASEHNLFPISPRVFHYEVDTVVVRDRVTFEALSNALDIPMEDIQYLNPMYRRLVIPPPQSNSEPFTLVLPISKIGKFLSNEASVYEYSKEIENVAFASNKEFESVEVQKKHKVKKGETMTRIAARYKCTVYDIKTWNNLKKNSVHTGQVLTIYVNKKVEVAKPESKPTTTDAPGQVAENTESKSIPANAIEETVETKLENPSKPVSSTPKSKFVTVKKGDTLFRIATENNLSLDELLKLNDLHRNSTLKIGQRLRVG